MPDLPTVTLDVTLSDLYKHAGLGYAGHHIAHIFCGVTSALDLTPDFPRNYRYVYQDSSFGEAEKDVDETYRRSLAIKFLSLVTQRDAFITGQAPVVFFHTSSEQEQRQHDVDQVSRTLSVLEPSQRCKPVFCAGVHDVFEAVKKHDITAITSKVILDEVADAADHHSNLHLETLVDFDHVWFLNSKAALAQSGLPSPKAEIIEIEDYHDPSVQFTPTGLDGLMKTTDPFSMDITSDWNIWLELQVTTILTAISKHEPPFVVKGNQSFGGSGTYVVETHAARDKLISDLKSNGRLKKLISFITPSNEHLNLGTVLVTELIKDPLANIGMTFFVKANGQAIFLAASEQMIDHDMAAWLGSTIVYSKQDALQRRLAPLLDRIAMWLHEHDYTGPVGADILETRAGELQIVDLNVRTSGSLCLPMLKTHFVQRGCDAVGSFSVIIDASREAFVAQWIDMLESGRMVIIAWYEESQLGRSYGDVVVGAEDEVALGEVMERVRGQAGSVAF